MDIAEQTAGHSGEGYVTGFDKEDDSVAITVNAPQEGIYELWIGYAAS